MSVAADIASCVWCGASTRPLVSDGEGNMMCSDERLCGTDVVLPAPPVQRRPPVTATVTPRPRQTLTELADAAEASALALLVTIRRSRREGHRLTRQVVEAQDGSRGTVLDYHRATVGRSGR